MRLPALFLRLLVGLSLMTGLQAQNPGAQQDAEAAREKLLTAADQLDNIQANSEATKTSVEGMKTQTAQLQTDLTKLQADNAALKQQLADLQAAFEQYKAEQVKARQALIDNVAGMIADKSGTPAKPKKKVTVEPTADTPPTVKKTELATTAPTLAPPPDPASTTSSTATAPTDPPPAPKPQKGYVHVVESGETLKIICTAYRENGVNVTMSAIRKANGLTEKSVLKPGQKLFIPRSGT